MPLLSATFQVYLIGGMFLAAGIAHFLFPDFYIKIMPEYLPAPKSLVYLSGFAELMLGGGFFFTDLRVPVTWAIILLLLLFQIVHVDMALNGLKKHGMTVKTGILILRFLLQFVLIWWVYRVGLEG